MDDLGPHFRKAPLLPHSQSEGLGKRQDLPAAVGGGAVAATVFVALLLAEIAGIRMLQASCSQADDDYQDPDEASMLQGPTSIYDVKYDDWIYLGNTYLITSIDIYSE